MPPQVGTPPSAGPPPDQLKSTADRLRAANNVLVTVSANPSVDQLAACIGLTLALNKMGKHGTAVYSGQTPSTIEFLKPEETLESTTDSLRDFIISLDKSKADKLRYKVEEDVVKIFITPYKTSISEKDFNFSEGDFNVDVVIALGVSKKTDLDRAITSHGRILHDATVISVATTPAALENQIGSMEWTSAEASSLCEMVTDLSTELDPAILDKQIATALLTGIVVGTDRFSNDKSRPHTMQVAGKLMEAGASTQLITTKLEQPPPPNMQNHSDETPKDGVLQIEHPPEEKPEEPPAASAPEPPKPAEEKPTEDKTPPPIGDVRPSTADEDPGLSSGPGFVSEPPELGGPLTANDVPEYQRYGGTTDPLSQVNNSSLVSDSQKDFNNKTLNDIEQSVSPQRSQSNKTLDDIEQSVNSPHLDQPAEASEPTTEDSTVGPPVPPPPPVEEARHYVEEAAEASDTPQPNSIDTLAEKELDEEENGSGKPPSSPPPPVPPPLTPNQT